ncbi:MAG TPA: hypothetical protein PKZ84_17290 [Anaerolineae bacterium]|nr:hypothetical protein [Anaerolineae bacterium]HQI86292.1 hypothetical protein [Anaerolineae bacterium]
MEQQVDSISRPAVKTWGLGIPRTVQSRRLRWQSALTVMFAAALLLWLHLRFYHYAFDDAYIHFRIAQNLVRYGAPYFNPDEAVKASSSSGWTLCLAGIIGLSQALRFTVDLPLIVACLNAVFTLCGAMVYTALLRRLLRFRCSALVCGLVGGGLYVSLLIVPSIGLMETAFALLVVGMGFHFLLDKRPVCLTLFGAAMFLRPELIVVTGLVVLYAVLTKRFTLAKIIFFTSLGALPFLIYDLVFFGTVLPNTVKAKSVVYTVALPEVLRSIVKGIVPDNVFFLFFKSVANIRVPYVVSVVCIMAGLEIYREVKSGKALRLAERRADESYVTGILFLWGLAVAGAYFITQTLVFQWYIPLYAVPLSLIFCKAWLESSTMLARSALIVLLAFFLSGHFLYFLQIAAAVTNPLYYPEFGPGARVKQYLAMGKTLYTQFPTASLLTSEIGGLGYGFRGYILDGVGLVSPEALLYHPMQVPEERSSGSIGAIPVEFIATTQPDLIVSYDVFIEAFLQSEVVKQYARARCPLFLDDDMARLPGAVFWESRYLNVFARKNSPAAEAITMLVQTKCQP